MDALFYVLSMPYVISGLFYPKSRQSTFKHYDMYWLLHLAEEWHLPHLYLYI